MGSPDPGESIFAMTEYFKTVDGRIRQLDKPCNGAWICVTAPDAEEAAELAETYGFDPDFIKYALDEEETSRIETDDGVTLIIVDLPQVEKTGGTVFYSTAPIGIIITKHNVITVSLHECPILDEMSQGMVRSLKTDYMTQFVLLLMLRVAGRYLSYLRQIDRLSGHIEQELRKSLKNSDLVKLIDINKSLVYFSTSLKSNEITLEKMMRGRYVKLYEDDQDLLEDVLIEFRQAIEMATIYSTVLSGTMEASSSLISNELNDIMKILASITIVISVPTIISGLYGMNIENGFLPFSKWWWFPCLLSVVGMVIFAYYLRKKNML